LTAPILDAQKVRDTIGTLRQRIEARFPGSGLLGICTTMVDIAARTEQRSRDINRPLWWVRLMGWSLITLLVVLVGILPFFLASGFRDQDFTLKAFMELGDPVLNEIVIVGALFFFLVTLETRYKRHRALKAIHELRSIAHVIDMHQLTKDPDRVASGYEVTRLSPRPTMNRFQLRRYLDYCSEMLSLTGKLAALYVQDFDDAVAIAAANDVESQTTGLSRKIWQKIMILHDDSRVGQGVPERPHLQEEDAEAAAAPGPTSSAPPKSAGQDPSRHSR
jgi:hypothetical protein